jgi:phospholipase D1/2
MPRALRAALVVLTLAAVLGGLSWLDLWRHLSLDSMRALVEAWGPLGPLVFLAVFVAGFFVPGPEILLVAVGGVLFGPRWGFVYAWVASVLGTATTFLLVRYTAQAWAQRALRERFPRLRALDDRLERHGVATVVLLRLLLFLAPPLNWALGASRVRVRDYVLGTALGVLPGIGLTVFLADRITTAGATSALLDRDVVAPAVILALLIVVGLRVGRRLLTGSATGQETGDGKAHRRAAGEGGPVEPAHHGRR